MYEFNKMNEGEERIRMMPTNVCLYDNDTLYYSLNSFQSSSIVNIWIKDLTIYEKIIRI